LTLWCCILVSGHAAAIAFLALDLHHTAGMELATASLLLVIVQACGVGSRVAWGAISDRTLVHGRKPQLIAITTVACAAALLMLAMPRSASFALFVPVAAVIGIGLLGYQGLVMTMIAETAGPARVGAATGFSVTFAVMAQAASLPFYGLVADLAGYRAIWAVLSALLVLAYVPALLVREPQR
jgi:MFS family permease